MKKRSKTLVEMAEAAEFYLQEEVTYQPEAVKKFFSPEVLPLLEALTSRLSNLTEWNEATLEAIFSRVIDRNRGDHETDGPTHPSGPDRQDGQPGAV